jgi:hypothetical protein
LPANFCLSYLDSVPLSSQSKFPIEEEFGAHIYRVKISYRDKIRGWKKTATDRRESLIEARAAKSRAQNYFMKKRSDWLV